jgi:hypothetical protein
VLLVLIWRAVDPRAVDVEAVDVEVVDVEAHDEEADADADCDADAGMVAMEETARGAKAVVEAVAARSNQDETCRTFMSLLSLMLMLLRWWWLMLLE